jgi:glutaredoxin
MSNIVLYEHGCPRCKVLKLKLDKAGIQYETVTDT